MATLGQPNLAVSQNGDAIAYGEDIAEPVRDVDDGDAVARLLAQDCVQAIRLRSGQGRGGFVQYQEFRVGCERPCDFNKLFPGKAQLADPGGRGRIEADDVKQLRRMGMG